MKLKIYNSQEDALRSMTECLIEKMKQHGSPFHLALSGASTASKMFRLWVGEYRECIDWEQLRFYWVDERCVGPKDDESNYMHADELLFTPLNIAKEHIFRIHGERDPDTEAEYYSEVVKRELCGRDCLPEFDCVILGIGEDGHTASIFPDRPELLTDRRCYAVAVHPQSGQKRITMTGQLILNGKMILVPVLGENKAAVLREVSDAGSATRLPAAYIMLNASEAIVYTDCKLV